MRLRDVCCIFFLMFWAAFAVNYYWLKEFASVDPKKARPIMITSSSTSYECARFISELSCLQVLAVVKSFVLEKRQLKCRCFDMRMVFTSFFLSLLKLAGSLIFRKE